MKVNVFGMLFNLLAICAVSNFVLVSAFQIPLSSEQKSKEVSSTSSSVETPSPVNETVVTSQSVEKSTPSSSENASVEGSEGLDTRPPLVFPVDEKLSPKNDTALKILQQVSAKSSEESKSNETISETNPLLSSSSSSSENNSSSSSSEKKSSSSPVDSETVANVTAEPTTTLKETTEEDYDNMSDEAENIQGEIDEKQEEPEEEFARTGSDKATITLFEDPVTSEPVLHSGHIALIFASSLVIMSVLAYIGLILWRGRLESRYGMRQRLVTNDDYYNNNDVRYFGL